MEQNIFINLRNILAHLYPDEFSIRRVIADSEIKLSRIAFASSSINNWHSILEEAIKDSKLNQLLEVVKREYPNNIEFQNAYHSYYQINNLTDKPNVTKVLLEKYISVTIEQLKAVTLRQYVSAGIDDLPLEELFVYPRLTEPSPLVNRLPLLESLANKIEVATTWQSLLERESHLLLIGELGSGKSTYCKWVACQMAKSVLTNNNIRLPIYISLLEFELFFQMHQPLDPSCGTPLAQFLQYHYSVAYKTDLPQTFWNHLFEKYPLQLILDGLDELATNALRILVLDLIHQIETKYQNIHCLITLRPDVYKLDLFSRSYHYSLLLGLNSVQQREFLKQITCLVNKKGENVFAPSVKDFELMLEDQSLKARLKKPLYLLVAYLHFLFSDVPLKSKETFIQKKMIELASGEWTAAKHRTARIHSGSLVAVTNDDFLTIFDILIFLGWELYQQNKKELRIDDVIDGLIRADSFPVERQTRPNIMSKLQQIADCSDILNISPQKISFHNDSDKLFFAAYNFVMTHKSWVNLIPYFTGFTYDTLIKSIYDMLLLADGEIANDFLEFLIIQSNGLQPNSQAHLICVIVQCLLQTESAFLEVKETVITSLLKIVEEKKQEVDLRIRINLGHVLGLLGDPRIGSMVFIPKGEFMMGYDMFPEDRPAQPIYVDDFYIDKYPVTNTQYALFMEDQGYSKPEYWTAEGWRWVQEKHREFPKYWNDSRFNHPNYPVVGVSWYEAAAYAKWAGKRLPTEKEWEKAARGSQRDSHTKQRLIGRSWAWGDEFRSDFLNYAESQDMAGQPLGGTTSVGIYPAGVSPYGIYDMCGTVSEWTHDWYKAYEKSTHIDTHFGEVFKVRRGGGWAADLDFVRCTCRIASLPTADYAVIGFRCCATMRP